MENKTDYRSINKFLNKIGELKHLDRAGWVLRNIKKCESVSSHMWRMGTIATILFDPEQEKDIDINKVIKLSLIHDLAECIVGDVTPYDNITPEEKCKMEMNAINDLATILPKTSSDNLKSLFTEYEERKSKESKLTKELDVMDAVYQAYEYEQKDVDQNGELTVDMEHFFVTEYLNKIQHPLLKSLLDQLLVERSEFLSKCNNNNLVKFDSSSSSNSSQSQ